MIIGIALILIGTYVFMPQAVATTLIVFGAIKAFFSLCKGLTAFNKTYEEAKNKRG